LPILHTDRGHRHYTALYSNTEHAHAMGTTHDWVVIYLEDHNNRGQQGRWTVITSQFGNLKGRRIVRGRENECADFYKGLA
jgi:putative hydrolase